MDLGMEGNFWIHEDFINEKIHSNWIIDRNQHLIKLAKTSFETVFGNDIEISARNAWLSYFKRNIFYQQSVVDLVEKYSKGEFTFPQNIDIVTGGFPCQDFSIAGKRKGLNSHKSHDGNYLDEKSHNHLKNRGMLYYWMKKVIEITQPKIFIAENVKGLNSLSEVKSQIESDFKAINNQGYIIFCKLLYAPDYGIPQTRERLFFIGINKQYLSKRLLKLSNIKDFINPFPEITHCDPQNSIIHNNILKPYSTVRSALSGLLEPELETKDQAQMKFSRAKFYGKTQGQIEVNLDGLSPTIRAEHHGNIEFRRLSVELGGRYHDEINSGKKK